MQSDAHVRTCGFTASGVPRYLCRRHAHGWKPGLAFWLSFCLRRESVTGGCRWSVAGSCGSKRSSLSLTQARTWQGPFAPRALPRFNATTNPADSRPEPSEKLCLPFRRCIRRCAPSGLPGSRQVFRYAPPPLTPEGPTSAYARCFLVGDRLQHFRKTGHLRLV